MGNTLIGLRHEAREPRIMLAERGDLLLVSPCPRLSYRPPERTIEFPEPIGRRRHPRLALAGALIPAAVGALIAWLTGSLEFLLFAAMSPVLALSAALGDRLRWRRSQRSISAAHRRAREGVRAEIADALAVECAYSRNAFPDPAELERIASVPTSRLWERGPTDPEFLRVRLGTARLPSHVKVRSGGRDRPAASIAAMPVCIDLRAGPLGLAGPADDCVALARHLVGHLAVLHSPAVVRLALVLPHGDTEWHWARWLPHLDGRVATDPNECVRLAASLTRLAELPGSSVVIIVDAAGPAPDHLHAVAALEERCCVVYLAPDTARLPRPCRHVVNLENTGVSRAVLHGPGDNATVDLGFAADQVDSAWAERVARDLAPLRDGSAVDAGGDSCPALCDLLDVGAPDPELIVSRWGAAEHHPTTVLGVAGDGPVWVDLASDGPHCLVAGTTGAGKSELLRTLVTGLALGFPPSRLSFLLIDYKGGAAFADCAELPHTAGLVTDLDAQLTRRALRSLNAELRRREVVLASVGAADIEAFHRIEPERVLPRLIVVVDEFATLADELPDFVKGLIGVAQRGRSLGVHLVLATQRPGRAMTPEIKANTSLRVALRVTDAAESLDIIDSPVAAGIPQHSAGVAYMRRGDQLTRFRTALARPGAAGEIRVELLDRWRRPAGAAEHREDDRASDGNLRTVVSAIRDAAARNAFPRARSPWLPPLPARLDQPGGSARPDTVELGLVDLPDEQRQATLAIDLADPSAVLACGTSGSGRTSLLLGAALRVAGSVSPADLEIYVVERGSALRSALGALPHLATAISAGEAPGLVDMLLRRLAFAPRARRLLLVDDWDAVLSVAGETLAGWLNEQFAHLLRVAVGHGLTILVTGDRGLLTVRWTSSITTRLLLRLADRADYSLAGIAARDVPAALPPGRGVRAQDGAEVQLFAVTSSSADASAEAATIASRWPAVPTSGTAVRLRRLPDQVPLERCGDPPTGLRFGLGGDLAAPLAIDPFGAGHLVVAGPPRSGRSTALLTILFECLRTAVPVVVAAPSRSPLHEYANRIDVRVIGCDWPSEAVGDPPTGRAVLLVDDYATFDETAAGERLASWLRRRGPGLAATVAGRTDELISAYRGLGAEARRDRCGLLLRPTALDGELLGVRLDRGHGADAPPGRGVLIGVRCWTAPEAGSGPDAEWALVDASLPLPVQVAAGPGVDSAAAGRGQPPAMCGYR